MLLVACCLLLVVQQFLVAAVTRFCGSALDLFPDWRFGVLALPFFEVRS